MRAKVVYDIAEEQTQYFETFREAYEYALKWNSEHNDSTCIAVLDSDSEASQNVFGLRNETQL